MSKVNVRDIELDSSFPKPSSLFATRQEASYVVKPKVKDAVISKILTIISNAERKSELLINTYFEPILEFEPEESYIVRFRQRGILDPEVDELEFPEEWELHGPGTLELKTKRFGRAKSTTTKSGTFFPADSNKSLHRLLEIVHSESGTKGVLDFINSRNSEHSAAFNSPYLQQIDAEKFSLAAGSLFPYAARINIRHTFESNRPENLRITFEEQPAFYAFPISHLASPGKTSLLNFKSYLADLPDRAKVEIKTETESANEKLLKEIDEIIKEEKIPANKYATVPYYKMINRISQQHGTLSYETSNIEVEAKASIPNKVEIEDVMEKLRNRMLNSLDDPYALFPTEPYISTRDYAELNRTAFGWQDENGWHEVATLIRLTDQGRLEYPFSAILKWKSDPQNHSDTVLTRKEMHEYLQTTPPEPKLLKVLCKKTGKNIQAIGTFKKVKHRIFVQNVEGRNFCISLDNVVTESDEVFQQMETEYIHTVTLGQHAPTSNLQQACDDCLNYFIRILDSWGVKAEKTTMRKVDFLTLGKNKN